MTQNQHLATTDTLLQQGEPEIQETQFFPIYRRQLYHIYLCLQLRQHPSGLNKMYGPVSYAQLKYYYFISGFY